MNLIAIQKNLLVNPEKISLVEIISTKGKESVLVVVEGRSIALEVDFNKFMKDLSESGVNNQQHVSL
jgi:hypothetical protein